MTHFSAHLTRHPSRTLSEQLDQRWKTHNPTAIICFSGLCNHMALSKEALANGEKLQGGEVSVEEMGREREDEEEI